MAVSSKQSEPVGAQNSDPESKHKSIVGNRKLTPMLRQYLAAKEDCPEDAILLFRMGDFFELFFDDAVDAAQILDITLTSRDKKQGNPIPMAGVPHHAIDQYIQKLLAAGRSVALCDQVEDPKASKGIVKREIVRLVTPSTQSDLGAMDPRQEQFLASVVPHDAGHWVVGLFELLSGRLVYTLLDRSVVADELNRLSVQELLCEARLFDELNAALVREGNNLPVRKRERLLPSAGQDLLRSRVGDFGLEGLDPELSRNVCTALGLVLQFAEETQRQTLRSVRAPIRYESQNHLILDGATRRNLELLRTVMDADRRGSLLWHLDRCKTAMGSRYLRQMMLFPLKEKTAIETRLDAVEALIKDVELTAGLREALSEVRDMERLSGRVSVGRANPRDLVMLRHSLLGAQKTKALLEGAGVHFAALWGGVDALLPMADLLERCVEEQPPVSSTAGGIFRLGYRDDLDEVIKLSTQGHDFLVALEQRERASSGIATLKVGFNKVFGYYLEASKAQSSKIPKHYVRKQTLVNAERYITDELKSYEDKVLGADERRKALEKEYFDALLESLGAELDSIRTLASKVAEVDALLSLAQVARQHRYVRPELCEDTIVDIEEGRHPVVERLLDAKERFVPNSLKLDTQAGRLLIVTGPNMAGKSTVMRQVALTALLAHMGSFVPAKRAKIGLCDRIFTRVGASDNLGRGQSTFMVEMTETAAILEHASAKSLVLLDEIGRGTSTFDGVSIAWSVAEDLHDRIGCRTMFATHYHELTDLALEREGIENISVAVAENEEDIVFLRRLVKGPADRSYGIEVAKLAGFPSGVLSRARQVLHNLESQELDAAGKPQLGWGPQRLSPDAAPQLSLFPQSPKNPAMTRLEELEPEHMTPIEALVALAELSEMVKKSAKK